MQISENVIKNRWRTLLQKFKSEAKLESLMRSGDGADQCYRSQWPHYQSLQFLKDKVLPAEVSGNLNYLFDEDIDEDEEDWEPVSENNPQKELTMPKYVKTPTDARKNPKTPTDVRKNPKPPTDGQKNPERIPLVEKNKNKRNLDDDHVLIDMSAIDSLFFKTLAYHVQRIHPDRLLHFRNEINDVVQRYAYEDSESAIKRVRRNCQADSDDGKE